MNKFRIKIMVSKMLIAISFVFFLTSCHSDYLNLEIRKDGTFAWNKDSTAFAFIARTRLYRMPVGIAKFPDGGQTKNEYLRFSLYYFDIKQKKLTHLIDLNEFFLRPEYRWLSFSQIALNLQDSLLFYKLKKPSDYVIIHIDEKRPPNYLEDISKIYSISLLKYQKSVVDTTVHNHLFDNKREILKFSSTKDYLSGLKYSDWSINLKELCPQSKNTYMDYIVKEEGNGNMRQVIFEQIVLEFTKKDREDMLKEMQKRKQLLYKEFRKLDRETDPYRQSLAKDRYKNYILYIEEIKRKLNIPTQKNKIAEQTEVLRNLKKLGISIPDDFEFKEVLFIGEGYEAEFELKKADSTNIDKYKKWFRNQVTNLLNHQWELDKQTKFEKPDSAGIVVSDLVNFIFEHTGLKYKDKAVTIFLDLSIDYGIRGDNKSKFLTFSVSEEYR